MKTDPQLRDDVVAELRRDVSGNDPNVAVAVRDGIVTRSGQVRHYAETFQAKRAAQRVSGVKALAVELVAKPSDSYARTDTDIARAA